MKFSAFIPRSLACRPKPRRSLGEVGRILFSLFRRFGVASTLVVLLSIFYLLPSVASVQAQTTETSPSYLETTAANTDRERVFSIFNGIISFTSCQLAGRDFVEEDLLCPGQENTEQVGGALGLLTGTIPMFYTSPASNVEYTHYLANNFGIAKSTYAQGEPEGFYALSPVLGIWTAVRNLTYIIAVVFFILIGFGIMVRFKVDPRTVMTIQNQIPKIIVALVLITFSYSIAGLMIDVMWLTTYTGLNVLGGSINQPEVAGEATRNILNNPLNYTNDLLNAGTEDDTVIGPLKGIRDVAFGVGSFAQANVDEIVREFLDIGQGECSGWWDKITSPVDCGIKASFAWVVGIIFHAIIALIIFFAIFIALLRVWIMLLKSYVYIIIYIALAPFWILLGLLPESSFGFTNWVKSLTARLLVFPATALLFMAARIFIDDSVAIKSGGAGGQQVDFIPPLVGNPNIIVGGDVGIGYLIAFGIIMLGPEMLTIMMDAFKRTPFKYTPAITKGLGLGAAVPGAIAGGIAGRMWKTDQHGRPAGVLDTALYSKLNDWRSNRGGRRHAIANRLIRPVSFVRGWREAPGGGQIPPPNLATGPGLLRRGINRVRRRGGNINPAAPTQPTAPNQPHGTNRDDV